MNEIYYFYIVKPVDLKPCRFIKDVFNKYLRAHIEKFKGLSVDTDSWKAFLYEHFSDKVFACF